MDKHLPSRRANNVITNTAALLLFAIATLHLVRSIYGWEAQVGNVEIPVWVSWLAILLALYVAYALFRMDK